MNVEKIRLRLMVAAFLSFLENKVATIKKEVIL